MIDDSIEIKRNPDNVERATRLLQQILAQMGYSAEVEHVESDNAITAKTSREDSGLLIGKQGQTLDAIQQIINLVINKGAEDYAPILVDIDGYRERQKRSIEDLAVRSANQVIEDGIPVTLRPMTGYERRLVHITLKDRDDVETVSYGEDPGRRVTIYPKEASEGTPLIKTEPLTFRPEEEPDEEFYVELIEEEADE